MLDFINQVLLVPGDLLEDRLNEKIHLALGQARLPVSTVSTVSNRDGSPATGALLFDTGSLTNGYSHDQFLGPFLKTADRKRWQKFSDPSMASRFLMQRRILYKVLEILLGGEIGEIRLTDSGKPHLVDVKNLSFSISHTASLLLIGWSFTGRIGVDIELVLSPGTGPRANIERLADRFFHPAESAWLSSIAADARAHAFISLWTRKEAIVKAMGTGMFEHMREVELAPDFTIKSLPSTAGAIENWHLGSPGQGWQQTFSCVHAVAVNLAVNLD